MSMAEWAKNNPEKWKEAVRKKMIADARKRQAQNKPKAQRTNRPQAERQQGGMLTRENLTSDRSRAAAAYNKATGKQTPAQRGKRRAVNLDADSGNRVVDATFNMDGPFANLTAAQEAEQRGVHKGKVARERREQSIDRATASNIGAVTEATSAEDAYNIFKQAVDANKGMTAGASSRSQNAFKGAKKDAYVDRTHAAVEANENLDLIRQGPGDTVQVLNTGYGVRGLEDQLDEMFGGMWEVKGNTDGPYINVEQRERSGTGQLMEGIVKSGIGAIATAGLAPVLGLSGSGMLTGAGKAALSSGISGASRGDLDLENIAKSAAVGGVLGGDLIGNVPGLGDAYKARNFGGAFIRGGVNDLVKQGIMTGEISIEEAAKAGLLQSGIETGKDVWGDVRQTNDGNLIEGVDTINGLPMGPEDIERLTNTSDLYGLLGENGFLGKLGIDVGYMPTDYLGDALDFADNLTGGLLDLGGRPMENINEAAREAQARIDALPDDMPLEEKAKIIGSIQDDFYRDTARYDERFFDLTTERSDGAPLTGIYDRNPYGSNEPWFNFDGGGTGEPSTTPPGGTEGGDLIAGIGEPSTLPPTSSTPIVDDIFGLTPTTPQEEEFVREEEILKGVVPDPADPTITPDPDPPEMGTDPTEELPGEVVEELPGVVDPPVEELPGVVDPPIYEDPEQEELPEPEPPPAVINPNPDPGTAQASQQRAAQFLNEVDDKLFRLARVMSISGISDKQKLGAAVAIRELLRQKQQAVTGDITAQIDPETGEIIKGYIPEGGEKSGKKKKVSSGKGKGLLSKAAGSGKTPYKNTTTDTRKNPSTHSPSFT